VLRDFIRLYEVNTREKLGGWDSGVRVTKTTSSPLAPLGQEKPCTSRGSTDPPHAANAPYRNVSTRLRVSILDASEKSRLTTCALLHHRERSRGMGIGGHGSDEGHRLLGYVAVSNADPGVLGYSPIISAYSNRWCCCSASRRQFGIHCWIKI
jgi:hypothetical protein